MPEEQREQVTNVAIEESQRAKPEELADHDERRQPLMGGTRRISRKAYVRNL